MPTLKSSPEMGGDVTGGGDITSEKGLQENSLKSDRTRTPNKRDNINIASSHKYGQNRAPEGPHAAKRPLSVDPRKINSKSSSSMRRSKYGAKDMNGSGWCM